MIKAPMMKSSTRLPGEVTSTKIQIQSQIQVSTHLTSQPDKEEKKISAASEV